MKKVPLILLGGLLLYVAYSLGVHRGARVAIVEGSAINALTMAELIAVVPKDSEGTRKRVIHELRRQISLYETGLSANPQTAEYLLPCFALNTLSFRPSYIQGQQAISHARDVERSIAEEAR
jgi:hypothetical protein